MTSITHVYSGFAPSETGLISLPCAVAVDVHVIEGRPGRAAIKIDTQHQSIHLLLDAEAATTLAALLVGIAAPKETA